MFLVGQKRRVLAPQWLCCVSCSWNSGTGTGFLMFGVHLVLQMDVKLLWTIGSIGMNCARLDTGVAVCVVSVEVIVLASWCSALQRKKFFGCFWKVFCVFLVFCGFFW